MAARTRALATLACSGGHGRLVWLLPPWKPCEDGQGPADFAGMPLDRGVGQRIQEVRAILREVLADFPAIEVVGDLGHRDHRWYPDGLHPLAQGAAAYARQVIAALG